MDYAVEVMNIFKELDQASMNKDSGCDEIPVELF